MRFSIEKVALFMKVPFAIGRLGWCQLVLEEKPEPSWAWILFQREVIADRFVDIRRNNLLHNANIGR
jgi:hypothetical protein